MNKLSIQVRIILYVVLSICGIVMLFPFYWMVIGSISRGSDLLQIPPVFYPPHIVWENYATILFEKHFIRYFLNTVFVTVFDVGGMLISCSLIAYGFALFQFKGKRLIFLAMLSTLMLPGQVTLVPTFFIWQQLHAIDTYFPLIVQSYLGKAFGILLLHQYFKTLPKELYHSAYVDGANPFKIFYKIYLPLSKPALATLGIFTFLQSWNDTLHPLIYLSDNNLFTLPLALLIMKGQYDTNLTANLAGSFVALFPVVIVFLIGQRFFIEGVARAGLKG